MTEKSFRDVMRSLFPKIAESEYERPFADGGVDSFSLLELRLEIEKLIGYSIKDRDWVKFCSLSEIISFLEKVCGPEIEHRIKPDNNICIRRDYSINMPQMALGGLSEAWLFRELGDIHWKLICDGLGRESSSLVDGNGDRLYATFTRIHLKLDQPMTSFRENENVNIMARPSRFGAGLFFSTVEIKGENKIINASLMSSFAKRGTLTDNSNLLKGQPFIPLNCSIPESPEMPNFALEYRRRRELKPSTSLFASKYDIIPHHDINGVGLLYFAAYPSISDICELRYMSQGNRWASTASTIERDVYYFANCNIDDSIIYRIHAQRWIGGNIELESSLSRVSDDALMAYLITRKKVSTHG
jgi:probable biosynthetic protein (TIGR04098 family)